MFGYLFAIVQVTLQVIRLTPKGFVSLKDELLERLSLIVLLSSGQSDIRTRAALNRSISQGRIHVCENNRRDKAFNDGLNVKRNIGK